MAIKYAKQVFSINDSKNNVYNAVGVQDVGTQGYAVFTVSASTLAGANEYLGAVSTAAATTSPCIIGICGYGTPLSVNDATPFRTGAVKIDAISVLASGTFVATNGATVAVQAYRMFRETAGVTAGWGNTRIYTGTTAAVTHVVAKGGSNVHRQYDVSTISSAVACDTDAFDEQVITADRPLVLRSGDMLCLQLGSGAITQGTGVMTIQVLYTRMNKGARFSGVGTREDGSYPVA